MSKASGKTSLLQKQLWQCEKGAIAFLSCLNYRSGELCSYLHSIAWGVSELLQVDWSVVTLCQQGFEEILASNIDMGEGEHVYSLDGSLVNTVLEFGHSLAIENAVKNPEYGKIPEGYYAYLGLPLRTAEGKVIGTICSFHSQPRKFEPQEIQVAEMFAERAATAIDNYYLYQQQCEFNQILESEVEKRNTELRAVQAKLVEQERLAAIGEFAAMIVHEIRNPLTTIIMGLRYFKKTILTKAAKERLSLALSEASRLENLLSEILLYAKPQVLQLYELDVNEFIEELLRSICEMPEAISRKIKFIPAASTVKILGDRDKLKQVFINICRNACEAISPGDVILWEIHSSSPGMIDISVCNGGEVIPPEIISKLTQPFFSTKSSGTGLGLAITKRIVNAHGGELLIQSHAVSGTMVTVQLPAIAPHTNFGF